MIITDHPALIKCAPSETIWRYMDLEKLQLLLKNRALFLCRSDKFSDPFEGSTPKKEAEHRVKEEMRIAESFKRPTTPEKAKLQSDSIANLHRKFKRAFVVSCWHINSTESDAMWRLYLKTNEGVAIQSTYNKLVDSLSHNEEEIFISRVRYIDYERDTWPGTSYNLFAPIVHKRNSFAHENELRVFQQINPAVHDDKYWNKKQAWWVKMLPFLNLSPATLIGKNISCDVGKLIDKVILPPTAENDVEQKVNNILKKYHVKVETVRSKLIDEPVY